MSILGTRVVRTEDPRFLTAGGTYLADLDEPLLTGALVVTYARSMVAHADLGPVHVDEAASMSGVVAVVTGADLDLPSMAPIGMLDQAMTRPLLAQGRVRFVGETIAAVVSDEAARGADAAALVWADYEPRAPLLDVEEAATGKTLLFPEAGTNRAVELDFGRSDDLFAGCDVVVRQRLVNQRLAPCPMETRAAAAAWDDADRLHMWVSNQHPHGVRDVLAATYGLDPRSVRVVTPDVGGGFGAKIRPEPEIALLPWLARRVGRPVRWVETRSENMVGMVHGRGQVQRVEIGGRRDGTIEAYRLTVDQDAGAYPTLGAVLPYMTRMMAPGVYAIPKVECSTASWVTNTTPTSAYRGAGRPEATAAIERAVDLFAAEVGLDPADVRRRNLVQPDQFPHTTAVGTTYDNGDYPRALELALSTVGYDDLRVEQATRRAGGSQRALGIGLSVYVEVTAGPTAGNEYGRVEVHEDGSATVISGTSPQGQGHATSWAMLASAELGIALEHLVVVTGDTDRVERGGGTMGSRSLQLGGSAVVESARRVVDLAREAAARLLEADIDDVVLDRDRGCFHVVGAPAVVRSWADVAKEAVEDGPDGALAAECDFQADSPTFPFGAHVAVVEVDTETGAVDLLRLVTVDDCGRIVNPVIVEGQRHGGIAQGVGQALYEEFRYDADGNPVTGNLADYAMVSAAELPSFDLVTMETPTPVNPLGAKGVGESGTIGATPAVQNAVCDALVHLGVRHIDLPCTPERVWRAIRAAAATE
jgi:carbon-monoxide dehydrogenase large subunit